MPSTRSQQFAAGVLALGGGLLAVGAFAIVVARVVLSAGLPGVHAAPEDLALLADLIAVLPFVVTFAIVNLVGAIGLVTGRTWAPGVARWVTGVAVATGLAGLLLLIAANGPVPPTQVAQASDPDGFAIVSVFVCLYAWAAIAVRLPDEPRRPVAGGAAAGLTAVGSAAGSAVGSAA
jgi:hypothetical protein